MTASRNRIPKKIPPALPWLLAKRAIPRTSVMADDSAIQECQVSGSSSGCGSPVIGCLVRGSCGVAEGATTLPPLWDVATLQVSGNDEMWSRGWLLRHEEETGNPVKGGARGAWNSAMN